MGPITLDEALRLAFAQSPDVVAAAALVAVALGRQSTARTFPHNPHLSGEMGARLGLGETTMDWAVGLDQTVALSGRQGRREDVAAAELAVARATHDATRKTLAVRVRIAFIEAVRARELLAVEGTQIELARSLLSVAERRLAAGASTRLDVNLARVDLGRAEGRLNAARGRAEVARAQLAESMGTRPSRAPFPTGSMELVNAEPLPPVQELLVLAAQNRGEMVAAEFERRTARARVELAQAEAVPEVGVSVFYRREANVDSIVGGGLSVPLPLFDQNHGAIAEAGAGEHQAEAAEARLSIQIEREVVAALAELTATQATAAAIQAHVVGTLEENLGLLQQAFESGKVSSTEVLIFRQQFRDSRVELVEAQAAAALARIQLDAAVGRVEVPPASPPSATQEPPR